ncbi:MAG: Nramp family divalent metal transporter [Culicoidibacterales bacterium]
MFFKYLGPGFIVTVGFIDPGNWAANIGAGSEFGYTLLWVVALSTIMLIFLQYNAAKLGIISGLCLAEASTKFFPRQVSRLILGSAYLASISTAIAELLGGALALEMLFKLPFKIGVVLIAILVVVLIFSNQYRHIESWIIGFVSIIGFSFLYELFVVNVDWGQAITSTMSINVPNNSILLIMSVLGAVVMPHNLFLHSEFIQSREYDVENQELLKSQLKYAKTDTLISMFIGFLINAAIVILAAAAFHSAGIQVSELSQAQNLLNPILGKTAAGVFALALLFAGISSSVTAGMSGGIISSGSVLERYNANDRHTTVGILGVIVSATCIIFFIHDTFQGLILSQVVLSVQLPITIITLLALTGSRKVMGDFADSKWMKCILFFFAGIVIVLNLLLLIQLFV